MRIFMFASFIFFFGFASFAQAYPLICEDSASKVTLRLESKSGSGTLSELSAELTGLRHWSSGVNFKLKMWGVDGWGFSNAYNGASGALLLKVSHVAPDARISVTEVDCRNSRIGEPCKVLEEKTEMTCKEL